MKRKSSVFMAIVLVLLASCRQDILRDLVIVPEAVEYKLSVICEAGGRVENSSGGKTAFLEGERCMLTALPDDGYVFAGWTGDVVSPDRNICVTFESDLFLSASFSKLPSQVRYSLDLDFEGAGKVEITPSQKDYSPGEEVFIKALADDGYMFSCWSDGSKAASRSLVMDGDKSLSAEFKKRQWTLLAYMAADNDLEASAILDINEMEAADFLSGGISVLALLDRAEGYDGTNGNWTDTRLYEIKHDDDGLNGNIVSKRISCNTLGLSENSDAELDMADPNVLYNVMRFAESQYQAENYGLLMWGHGTGWRGGGSVSQPEGGAVSPMKAIAFDDYCSSYMTIAQLHQALSRLPEKLAFLGFDTCYGALLETAWEFRNDAEYMVASCNSVPSNGWNYQTFLDRVASSGLTTENIADSAVDSFSEQYGGFPFATISKIKLDSIGDVKNAFERFTASAVNGITSELVAQNVLGCVMRDVISYSYAGSACDMFIDMYSFVKQINSAKDTLFTDLTLIDGMEYRHSSFVTALNRAVSSWSGDGSRNARLSIFFTPLNSAGAPTAGFSHAYIKNSGDLTQSSFVKDSANWVPDKSPSTATFLNRLFFTEF